jgi:endonuclease YncB( thermonuclease family)
VEAPDQEKEVKVVAPIATSSPTTTDALPNAELIEEEPPNEAAKEVPVIPVITSSEPATEVEPEADLALVPENDLFKVVSVVDGDTVKLDMNGTTETIRLIGLDTPETVHPQKPVECMGIEASNKAKQLLIGQSVRFESDDSQDTRDRFGRLLGYVFLPNGDNFAEVMLRSGYGNEYTYDLPYKYQTAFKSAEQYAQSNQLGLWADGVCEDEEQEEPEPEPVAAPTSDGQKWYVSSHHSSKFYYCEDSDGWEGLSPNYLEVYESETALRAEYPNHTLHESCL